MNSELIFGFAVLIAALSFFVWKFHSSLITTREKLRLAECNLIRFKPILDVESETIAARTVLSQLEQDAKNAASHHAIKLGEYDCSLKEMKDRVASLTEEVQLLTEDHDLLSAGFYRPKYDFESSVLYQNKLDANRSLQKELIKKKHAITCSAQWEVGGSKAEGKKMTDRIIKLGLSAFNVQCDNEILSVRFDNIDKSEAKLTKIRENVDKLLEPNKCKVMDSFFKLKLEELFLVYEYREKKHKEKEEQKTLREQMREEEKALRDAERAQAEAAKEEKQSLQALEKARKELEARTGDERVEYAARISELEAKLVAAQDKGARAKSMAEFTRRGHVYIISNIGSFGEDVYKIGMTRRLDPMDRVWELSDASVPFDFDVHAIIPTDDAPTLERKLHEAFEQYRINRVNDRKEFFKVNPDEISMECRKLHHGELRLTLLAEAKEFRQSVVLLKQNDQKAA